MYTQISPMKTPATGSSCAPKKTIVPSAEIVVKAIVIPTLIRESLFPRIRI